MHDCIQAFDMFGIDQSLIGMPFDLRRAKRVVATNQSDDFMAFSGERTDQGRSDQTVRAAYQDFH